MSSLLALPDGAQLQIHDSGGALPALIIGSGLGGPFRSWQHQLRYFGRRFRVISWDYRGLYGSQLPPHEPRQLTIEQHVADLVAILDHLGIRQGWYLGWSIGVQVGLELAHRHPDRVSHLVLVNGTPGQPLRSSALPIATRVAPLLALGESPLHSVGARLLQRSRRAPEMLFWLKGLGLVAPTIEEEEFRQLVDEFSTIDLTVFLEALRQAEAHDARAYLHELRLPVLLITGEKDPFTSRKATAALVRGLPQAEHFAIPKGTHYVVLEQPELVNLRIDKFLHEHGVGSEPLA